MTASRLARIVLAAPVALALLAPLAPGGSARAQESGDLQALIDALKAQLDRGERERLIDPWFLRDLRQTLARYEYPWHTRLFEDDFSGRGPQPDPPWRVTAGEFLIDWRYGLRSVVAAGPAAETPQDQGGDEEAVKQLFGQILSQALQDQSGTGGETGEAPQAGYAAAIAPVAISNAFALRIEMTARPVETAGARFEFGPYQGESAAAGYRLAYVPGAASGTPGLELLRLSARGTISTLEIHTGPVTLEDDQAHTFEWTRDGAGRMVVKLDGDVVMDVVDRGFRDPFDGLAVVNSGGDYALRRVTIDGV